MEDDVSGQIVTQVPEGPPKYPPNTGPDRSVDLSTSPDFRTGIVKRAMGKTTEKLNRSKSNGNKTAAMSQSQPSLPVSGHRRIFSLNRSKGKERASADGERFGLLSNRLAVGKTEQKSQMILLRRSPNLPLLPPLCLRCLVG